MGTNVNIAKRPTEDFQRLYKRFKKACEKAGLISDIKKHSYYEKPSERRRREGIKRRKNMLKALGKIGKKRPTSPKRGR